MKIEPSKLKISEAVFLTKIGTLLNALCYWAMKTKTGEAHHNFLRRLILPRLRKKQ